MKLNTMLGLSALAVVAFSSSARAQTASHLVSMEVEAINQLALSGTPSLTVSAATAGSAPTPATFTGSYAITTNELGRKITAELDSDMPSELTLSASLAAPAGAVSGGSLPLSTVAQDVVTGIEQISESGLNLTYTLTATAKAAIASIDRTVTYTIVADQ